MNSKCIFLDIDHTIIDNSKDIIPESTVLAIKQAKKNGHKLFICSGRPHPCVDDRVLSLPVDGFISSAGADIRYNGKIIVKHTVPDNLAINLITNLLNNNISLKVDCINSSHAFLTGQDFVKKENKYHLKNLSEFEQLEYFKKHKIYLNSSVNELIENNISDYAKFTVFANTESEIKNQLVKLDKEFKYYVSRFPEGDCFGEITYLDTNKSSGIREIINYLKIPLEITISIGDSVNDIDMIEYTKIGVAMGNACDKLKNAADYITDDIDKDGLYKAFKHLNII